MTVAAVQVARMHLAALAEGKVARKDKPAAFHLGLIRRLVETVDDLTNERDKLLQALLVASEKIRDEAMAASCRRMAGKAE